MKSGLQICIEVCEWTKKHNKKPSLYSKNPLEKRYGVWINNFKTGQIRNNRQQIINITKKYGLPNLLKK